MFETVKQCWCMESCSYYYFPTTWSEAF